MTTRNCFRLTSVALMAMAITFSACRSSKRAAREKETDTTTAASPQVSVDEHGITVTPQQGDDSAKNKKADKAAKSGKSKKSSVVARINENRQTARGIRGKMSIGLRMGDGTSLSASGSIKMKRDEIIQLSITALGLVELGRMELTPKYLFIQDRYHKRYLKSAWSDIPSLKSAGVDFNTFQALFWNELYVPGRSAEPSESDFLQSSSGLRAKLEPKDAPEAASLLFYTDEDQKLVYQTTLIARNGKLRFDGNCSSWSQLDGKQFPAALRLAISVTKEYVAELTFTRLQVDESMGNIATTLSDGKYTQVSLEEVLKGLHM